MQTAFAYISKLSISNKLFHLLVGIALSVGLLASGALWTVGYLIEEHQFDTGVVKAAAVTLMLFCLFVIAKVAGEYVRLFITRPILHLIRMTEKVSKQQDYQIQARVFHQDEVGTLAQTLNQMMSQVELRGRQLKREKEHERELVESIQDNFRSLEHEMRGRKKVEKQLKQFQSYLNNIINSMPSALITINDQCVIQQCNREAARLASASQHQLIGQPMTDPLPFLSCCRDQVATTFSEQTIQRVEKHPVYIGDQQYYMDFIVYPLSGEDQTEAVVRIDNVTERMKLEEVIVQTEKMMSVGGLAAGMAHEINNPLGAIVQGAQNIRRRLSPDLPANQQAAQQHKVDLVRVNAYLESRDIPHFIDNILDAGERASTIVSNMQTFSRQEKASLTPTNLNELLNITVAISTSDLGWQPEFEFSRIQIDYDLSSELIDVPCIASELQQVFLNLLKNAAYAIHRRKARYERGRILIQSRQEETHAVISFSDNGCGMTESTRKRIFEPFYTTKDVGIGTGLGLSVSYFIITTHHKGSLTVTSTPDVGTEFLIKLPLRHDTQTTTHQTGNNEMLLTS